MALRPYFNSHSIHNREFWTEFFMLYKGLPALWDTSSVIYKERAAKVAGYDIMVEKLREIEPNADREDVLRKINIFRTNFRREVSRINMSKNIGKHYKTTLWYFDLLSFLQNQEKRSQKKNHDGEKCIIPKRRLTGLGASFIVMKPRKQNNCDQLDPFDDFDENSCDNENRPENFITSANSSEGYFHDEFKNFNLARKNYGKPETDDDHETDVITEQIDGEDGFIQEDEDFAGNDGTRAGDDGSNNAIDKNSTINENWYQGAGNSMRESQKQITNNNQIQQIEVQTPKNASTEAAEILAKSWAIQYEEMPHDQKIYARKAIADILFDGCMGNLGRCTVQASNIQLMNGNAINNEQPEPVLGDRPLAKQQQTVQGLENVLNDFEECYVLNNGRTIKMQEW